MSTFTVIGIILVAINVAQYLGIRHEWRKAQRRLPSGGWRERIDH